MNKNILNAGLIASTLLSPALTAEAPDAPTPVPATYTWVVTGSVSVKHQIADLGYSSALAGIQVRLKARTKVLGVWGTWNSWGTVVTNSSGAFKFVEEKNGDDRQFRVEVKFDSDDLELRHETSTSSTTKVKWYSIDDRTAAKSPSTVDLGSFRFESGAADALGESEPRAHADIWCLATRAMQRLGSYGSSYGFKSKVKIKYPHESDVVELSGSYANPYTQVIYILPSHLNASTILHEMMHIWSYQQGTEEAALFEYLLTHGTTHGTTNRPVAFLEGFAEYAAENLLAEEFGRAMPLPLNRAYLNSVMGLNSIFEMERHDDGWLTMLRTLSCDRILYRDFLTEGASFSSSTVETLPFIAVLPGAVIDPPALSFKNVLRVFMAHSGSGLERIAFRGVSVDTFLDRARRILGGLDATQEAGMKELFDPAGTKQPKDLFIH